MKPSGKPAIIISATFVAEPIAQSLKLWIDKCYVPAQIEFVPYNNVVQVLLDSKGRFVSNQSGLNVVLLRFEDWARFRHGPELSPSEARTRNRELTNALITASSRCASPILVCVCPPSPRALENQVLAALFDELQEDLTQALISSPLIRIFPSGHLLELIGANDYYDAVTDRLGHIPYTPAAFAAFGTAIFRVFDALRRPPYKVIAVDCDNTLWNGICGEGGPGLVEIDAPSRAVQEFLKVRRQNGMLLCVCSKNNPDDVTAVFDLHRNMPLQWADFVATRVNWLPKSENLRSMARELSLGLDSFIFLDDNPAEVAEVRAHCPEVQAITLPANRDHVSPFLDRVWVFDQPTITSEDKHRTERYHEDVIRRAAATSMSYTEFLLGLNLKIDIRELEGAAEIDRAAQMTQRTNQFNFTTRRYTTAQFREAIGTSSTKALTAFVSDRYGDYGQVGLITYNVKHDALRIDTFLLSCRALGKGVEHAMMARLGEVASALSLSFVDIEYISTAKNLPAWEFLKSIGALPLEATKECSSVCRLPAVATAAIRYSPPASDPQDAQGEVIVDLPKPAPPINAIDYSWIALSLDARSIAEAVEAAGGSSPAPLSKALPASELERNLARLWERILRTSPVGTHDNFFDLGGDSLLAVVMIAELNRSFGHDLPLVSLIEKPTIAELARHLQSHAPEGWSRCVVPLKSSGSEPPFYCVHGVGGSVLELMDLAGHIHPDQPFFGIQAVGLADPSPPINMTVEEMSQRYIREIRDFQPHGPYYLGGSSFGGLVAYEMARQLTADGQPVALVALFDTSVPGILNLQGNASAWRSRLDSALYRCRLHWGNIMVLNPRERIEYIKEKVRHSLDRRELPPRIQLTQEAVQWAASRYIPQKYSGSVTLFRATEQPPWILPDPLLGWGSLAMGGVEVYRTPGYHADLVRNPRARVLAHQLQDALLKARHNVTSSSIGQKHRDC